MKRSVVEQRVRSRFLALWRAGRTTREIERALGLRVGMQTRWRLEMGLPARRMFHGGAKAAGKRARAQWTHRRCEDCGALTIGAVPCGVCGAAWKGVA